MGPPSSLTETSLCGAYLYMNKDHIRIMFRINKISPVGGKGEECTGCWWGNPRGRDRWGDPGVDGRIILGRTFRRWDWGMRTGLGWLRIGTGGGRL